MYIAVNKINFMKVDGVSFNGDWVRKFASAEEFAACPSNGHLYPELKTDEAKKAKLIEVFNIFNPAKSLINEPLPIGGKSAKAGRGKNGPKGAIGVAAPNGGIEPQADGDGGDSIGGMDNLPGEE